MIGAIILAGVLAAATYVLDRPGALRPVPIPVKSKEDRC